MSDELRRIGCYFTVEVGEIEHRVRFECRADGNDQPIADVYAHNEPEDALRAIDYLVSLAFLRMFGAQRQREIQGRG